jgi:hypothetical protein
LTLLDDKAAIQFKTVHFDGVLSPSSTQSTSPRARILVSSRGVGKPILMGRTTMAFANNFKTKGILCE